MSRKPNRVKRGLIRVSMILPSEIVVQLDAKAARLSKSEGSFVVTRSDVVRRALWKFLNSKKKKGE